MEYPMITLVTGERSLRSLVGVTVHEMAQLVPSHGGHQRGLRVDGRGVHVVGRVALHGALFADPMKPSEDPHGWAYASYIRQHLSGNEEPLITHADHYKTNRPHGGSVFQR